MNKEAKCPECRGKGVVPCNLEYGDDNHPENCPVCAGDPSVRMPCSDCEGTGKRQCY